MPTESLPKTPTGTEPQEWRDVPIDWEALEDAFENNAPEVHSYLHVPTGDVLRVVDGVADPQMHARIAADTSYLRIEPVSSREQYRWMERYIPMVEDKELQEKLARAIDGKGAFRRFKDVLMTYGPDREKWFTFRSERLRIFMEAWLNAHALTPVKRPTWTGDATAAATLEAAPPTIPGTTPAPERASQPAIAPAPRSRAADALRRRLRDVIEALGPRELDQLTAFGEFLQSRRMSARLAAGLDSQPSMPGPLEGFDDGDLGSSDGGAPTTAGTATPSSATVARRKIAAT
ncbi:MAG: hypothetical protein FJ095_00740 [Deltaproteobacteria bacterium]|nr:hypothetical protein [Deltaproteobacteria bacterium]